MILDAGARESILPGTASPAPPALAPGVVLAGEYRGSGYREPRFLVVVSGQYFQLTEMLYRVLSAVDGTSGVDAIAAAASQATGRPLSAEGAQYLLRTKLAPMGLIAGAGEPPAGPVARPEGLLAVRMRRVLVPARAVRAPARLAAGAFHPAVLVAALGGFAALDWSLLAGAARAGTGILASPGQSLALIGLLLAGTLAHELGHAAACHYGGVEAGDITAGVYLAWPALATDVTASYRLNRLGRIRTDLGGVYFNLLFALCCGGLYHLSGYRPFLLAAAMMNLLMAEQLLPLLRLDGYWVLTDLTGLPDLFGYLGAALRRLHRGNRNGDALDGLRPATRRLVMGWALATVVALPFEAGLAVVGLPLLAVRTGRAIVQQLAGIPAAVAHGGVVAGILAGVDALLLCWILAGAVFAAWFLGRRAVAAVIARGRRATAGTASATRPASRRPGPPSAPANSPVPSPTLNPTQIGATTP